MQSGQNSLKLSVLTIAYESASECKMVIQELQRQTIRAEIEVIIVASNRNGIEDSELDCFGIAQWVILPEIRTAGAAMAAAVRAAHAPYVTHAEEHEYFKEDWAEQLITAHEKGYDVVGFAMENANPTKLTSWAHLYGQFGPVVAPVESGEGNFLAGHHTSTEKTCFMNMEISSVTCVKTNRRFSLICA